MLPTLTFVYDRKGQATKTKPAVVELRITANKVRKYISTGVKLLPKEWSNGSVVGRKDWKEVNDQLQVIKRKCSEVITELLEDGNMDINAIPTILHDRLVRQKTFLDYCESLAEQKYKIIAEGTTKHYKTLFKFLRDWGGLISFSDVTTDTIKRMDDKLEKNGLKVGSRWNYHKKVKMFIDKAIEDGLLKHNPYNKLDIKKGSDSGLNRCLTPAEFHKIEQMEIESGKLRRVRDLFVFQTYTLMSYSDLEAFRYTKCTKSKGNVVYKARRKKTGQEFTVVLLPPALAILKKYKNSLPIISNVKYNLYLKEVMRLAKIKKNVSTHYARHTGATMLLNENNVPIHIVQHILGHASIRETERTYAKLMDSTIIDTMSAIGSL